MKIENVVKIKIPNCLTTEEMTICLLGRLVNPQTLHTSNEIEIIHGWRCMVSEGDSEGGGGSHCSNRLAPRFYKFVCQERDA